MVDKSASLNCSEQMLVVNKNCSIAVGFQLFRKELDSFF